MPEKNLQTIKALLKVSDTKKTIDEFVQAFKYAIESLNKMKAATGAELSQLRITFDHAIQNLKDSNVKDLTDIKGQIKDAVDKSFKAQEVSLNQLRDSVIRMQEGKEGEPGKDADEQAVIAAVLAQLPVHDVYDDAELKAQIDEHAKALEDMRSEKSSRGAGWGAHPLNIYQSGTIKAETARHINFTGATVTQSPDGVTTVAVLGGAGLSVLAATGTVDGSNVTFTFASTPTLVVVNGTSYRNGHGVTIVTTTATLDNPAGVGGDVYGLG